MHFINVSCSGAESPFILVIRSILRTYISRTAVKNGDGYSKTQ